MEGITIFFQFWERSLFSPWWKLAHIKMFFNRRHERMHRVPSCQPNLWFGHQHLLHLLETGTSETRFLVLVDAIPPPLLQPEITRLSYCGNR